MIDNRKVRDVPLTKLTTIAKTKLQFGDELVVLQVISSQYGKDKEIDVLFIPVEFFLDIPLSGTSTTGLPMREIESWLFFDDNGYLKHQPQREGPKGINIRLAITEFSNSPTRKQAANKSNEKQSDEHDYHRRD